MVRWYTNKKRLDNLVRESLPERTRVREDLDICEYTIEKALAELSSGRYEMERVRADGRLTETEHLRFLKAHLEAMGRAEDALCRALYLSKDYNQWPLR